MLLSQMFKINIKKEVFTEYMKNNLKMSLYAGSSSLVFVKGNVYIIFARYLQI